jgi:hypothetical protein
MDPIAEIRNRLTKYPQARSESGANSITVLPADDKGFPVSFAVAGSEYVVSFSGWHEHFTDANEALNCFAFGLSEDCRLKVYKRGNLEHRWTVESRSNGNWVEDSTTGLLFFPFWQRPRVEHLQNRLLPTNSTPQPTHA